MNDVKKCNKCQKKHPLSNFYFRKDNGKYRDDCKDCILEDRKGYALKNKQKIKERNKAFRHKNKVRLSEKNRAWRLSNPEHRKNYVKNNPEIIKACAKRSYIKNKENVNAKKKEWYQNNKEKHAKTRELYAINNKERLLAARRKWERNKMATDLNYLLQKTLRSRIKEALKCGAKKAEKTVELIGCSMDEFRTHIENQFTEGMSWDNWSFYGWHLDHKIPVSWFNLKNESCRKAAFNYKNMQPLWWDENFKKKNRYSHK